MLKPLSCAVIINTKPIASTVITQLDAKTLPDNLKNKSKAELLLLVNKKAQERTAIQNEIETVNAKREILLQMQQKIIQAKSRI